MSGSGGCCTRARARALWRRLARARSGGSGGSRARARARSGGSGGSPNGAARAVVWYYLERVRCE